MTGLIDNLHDVNKPIIGKNPCRVCGNELILGVNWTKSYHKAYNYLCKECKKKQNKEWRENNPEHSKDYNQTVVGKFRKLASNANRNCKIKLNYKQLICLFCCGYSICPYTEILIALDTMNLEHILAKTNGGDNEHTNLVFVSESYNYAKNGFMLDDFIKKMGKLINLEQMAIAAKEIDKIHNRYEFMIDRFLEMTDGELTKEVEKLTKPDNINAIDLLNT